MKSIARPRVCRGWYGAALLLLAVLLPACVQSLDPALAVADDDESGPPFPPGLEFAILPPAARQLSPAGPARAAQAGSLRNISLRDLVSRGPASPRSPPPIA